MSGERRIQPETVVAMRPLGTPLPIGLLGLAAGSCVVAALQLGWIGTGEGHAVDLILLAFVVTSQLVASLLGFASRDASTGTAMGVLAGSWAAIAIVGLHAPAGSSSHALGTLLVVSAASLLAIAIVAAIGKPVLGAVLGLASFRFGATAIDQLTQAPFWPHLAGIVGIVLAAIALLVAFSLLLEDATGRTLPWPLRRQGDAASEPGVRRRL
jgi:succinate-acetate transporter protein